MGKRDSKGNGEGQYVPLPYNFLKSAAWRSLSGAAVKVWLELHTRFNGSNNGKIHLSLNEAASALGMGKTTVMRGFAELREKGFIALEQPGNWYSRRAHEWRLTTKPMQTVRGKLSPTNDWRNWRPPKTERGPNSEPSASSVVPFQNPKPASGSKSVPVRAKTRTALGTGMEH